MEDAELFQLQEKRKKLLKCVTNAMEQISSKQNHEHQLTPSLNLTSIHNKQYQHDLEEASQEKYVKKLINVASRFLGISFPSIRRTWLQDNNYCYKTLVTLKAITFYLELSVCLEGKDEFEIIDITCHFVNLSDCYMLEIKPWMQEITRTKNFSLLLSAITQYNEKSVLRSKVLHSVEKEKYGTPEEYADENGGILIHIHSPANFKQVYLKLQWSIQFFDRTLQLRHFFTIDLTEIGTKFAEKNQAVLEGFCATNLNKEDLLQLWGNLLFAIDAYESSESKN